MTAGDLPPLSVLPDRSAASAPKGWRVASGLTLGFALLLAGLALVVPAHKALDPQGLVHSCDMNNPMLLLLFSQAGAFALLAYVATLPFTQTPIRTSGSAIRTALCFLLVLLFAVRGQAALNVLAQQEVLGCEDGFTVSPAGS